MAQLGATATPMEYAAGTAQPAQPADQQQQQQQQLLQQQQQQLLQQQLLPGPESATTINMVAQRLPPLAALSGDSNDHGEGGIGRSRSPSNTPPRGRWASNPPPVAGRGRARPTGPASDPGHGSPPIPPKIRAKPTMKPGTAAAHKSPPTKDWGGDLAQIRWRILAGDLHFSDIEKQLAETQKLTKNFDEFAGHFVKQQRSVDKRFAQLVQHQEGINERLHNAAQVHEAKLKTVEEAYGKQSARILEVEQNFYAAAAASSQAPTGATDTTGVAAVRERLDQLSRAALETEEKLATMHVTMQSVQAESFSESHRQFAQGMDYLRAEFEKRVADLDLRIAEGTCKCPASCPGTRAGTCGQAQGPDAANF